jgi:aspartyl-tRNA synthetase
LDYRWIDLRTPANAAIMRISSGVCALFREFLLERKFIEIQSPKLLAGASEGGSSVFKLKYFNEDACLAQSPQLYKQMTSACSDMERVFEIGPVFRAENSNTHRHLCEFHGLDLEMAINEHYYEALDLFSDLFIYIFEGLNTRFKAELEAVRAQHPFEDLVFHKPSLRITYTEGLELLKKHAGIEVPWGDDLSTAQEKALGAIVKSRYGTDFFIMDKYPSKLRPFYTMIDPEHPEQSNSYDMFLRGEEIVSGAQRVHDAEMLYKRIEDFGIPPAQLQSYIDSFKHGALPHAGGGIGLERVVFLFLALPNIRKASLFPRDPKRLTP